MTNTIGFIAERLSLSRPQGYPGDAAEIRLADIGGTWHGAYSWSLPLAGVSLPIVPERPLITAASRRAALLLVTIEMRRDVTRYYAWQGSKVTGQGQRILDWLDLLETEANQADLFGTNGG